MTEKEYIERGAVKQVIEEHMTRVAEKSGYPENAVIQGYLLGKKHALDWIDAVPVAAVPDASNIVMCNDCKRARPMLFLDYYYCRRYRVCRKSDDFCSRGKRREQTDETDDAKDHSGND